MRAVEVAPCQFEHDTHHQGAEPGCVVRGGCVYLVEPGWHRDGRSAVGCTRLRCAVRGAWCGLPTGIIRTSYGHHTDIIRTSYGQRKQTHTAKEATRKRTSYGHHTDIIRTSYGQGTGHNRTRSNHPPLQGPMHAQGDFLGGRQKHSHGRSTRGSLATTWLHGGVLSKKMAFQKRRPHATTKAFWQSEPVNQIKAASLRLGSN